VRPSFRGLGVPDSRRIFPVVSLTQLSGYALALVGTQVDVILDVPNFLILEALEYFHDLGGLLHENIISY
jgi:hypothetical protein